MGKHEKLLRLILSGRSDANVEFDALRRLLTRLGFEERTKGSHHVFRKSGIEEKINIQESGSPAKPYQVKQVRDVLIKYQLAE
ncbi:MAG: type II toxin-antitoxin system HicA family toxin [Wenzhouxiangella sp.]|jgi:predicted RNA binding protein YcfA (HicA-like mRNA interferase family)|nr:type II toxin-antitoxin system HicA family toxin [Wenzhouxiangella sp.]